MQILDKNEFLKEKDGTRITGLVIIQNYSEAPTKNGGSYLAGSLQACGDVPFKVWSGVCFNKMVADDLSGKICTVDAEVNEYNGSKSLILTHIEVLSDEELSHWNVQTSDFFANKYNLEAYWGKLLNVMEKHVSVDAMKVFMLCIDEYQEQFKKEFAAINYHDNCKGGLLAHTTKVVSLCNVLKMYTNISSRVSNDILYVGAALHDLGKVIEYSDGMISEQGKYVSHNTIGCLMLAKHRDEIVGIKGEEYYNTLLSIITQHHGDYGERPRTIAAYLIHQLDLLDSLLTLLDQNIETTPTGQLRFDDLKLI